MNISKLAAKKSNAIESSYATSKYVVLGLNSGFYLALGFTEIKKVHFCHVTFKIFDLLYILNSRYSPSKNNSREFLESFAIINRVLGRLFTLNEVAPLFLFFSLNKASWATGSSINIDCRALLN
jgi:NAD(P)-dependent dehydrogenase (short-subunit alcohol dehydrogenase family)